MEPDPILVVGPSWIGDMVLAQSLFMLIKERQPETPLDVLAPEWSLPLIARMPEVRRGIVAPGRHGELAYGKRRRVASGLRGVNYAQAIVLPRSFKAALVPWLARIPRRTGFRGEMRYGLINDMREFSAADLDQAVKRFLALGLEPGEMPAKIPQPALRVSETRQRETMARLGVSPDGPVVALMPGAEYGPAKCWPVAHFRALADALAAAGFHVWVLGSGKEAAVGAEIAAGGTARNLCGDTGLEEVVDLLAICRSAVSNDSGLMHIAAATGTRVVALYGSTTPEFTPPLTDNRQVHYLRLACSPCFARVCPLGHLRCLREITPDVVLDGILATPANDARPR